MAPNMDLLTLSVPGHILWLVTEEPALGRLWFRGVDNLAQKEDALGIGGKDDHKEGPVEPEDPTTVPGGQKGDEAASGRCSLGASLVHLQDGFVETLGRKSQVLPPREHEPGLREAWKNQRSLKINTTVHCWSSHLLISQQDCLHWVSC